MQDPIRAFTWVYVTTELNQFLSPAFALPNHGNASSAPANGAAYTDYQVRDGKHHKERPCAWYKIQYSLKNGHPADYLALVMHI